MENQLRWHSQIVYVFVFMYVCSHLHVIYGWYTSCLWLCTFLMFSWNQKWKNNPTVPYPFTVHPCYYTWQIFIFLNSWIVFYCVYRSHFFYSFFCQWALRLSERERKILHDFTQIKKQSWQADTSLTKANLSTPEVLGGKVLRCGGWLDPCMMYKCV